MRRRQWVANGKLGHAGGLHDALMENIMRVRVHVHLEVSFRNDEAITSRAS